MQHVASNLAKGAVPWCPNCKAPLTLDDVGTLQRSQSEIPRFWTSLLFCKKCGVILGGSGT